MRYAAGAAMRGGARPMPGLLLADAELAIEPTHVTIIGRRDDAAALALHSAARALPALYKRLDWWDRSEGPLPNPDVQYPDLGEAAAFASANRICSLPVFCGEDLAAVVATMLQQRVVSRD